MINLTDKNILILGAMESELALLYNTINLHVIKTGVGRKKVHKCIQNKIIPLLSSQKIDLAINIGFAGSLDKNIKKYTLVFPRKITHHATQKTLLINLEKWSSFLDNIHSLHIGPSHLGGHLLCIDHIFNKKDKRLLNKKESGYHYIDMESFWLGRFMQERGIPFFVIRCILDAYTFQFPPLQFLRKKWPLLLWKEALLYFPLHPRELLNLYLLHIYEKKAAHTNTFALTLFLKYYNKEAAPRTHEAAHVHNPHLA
ncbi:MAG: hypothetical protein ACMUJM_21130 [bacterium]